MSTRRKDKRTRRELQAAVIGMSHAYLTLLAQAQRERKMWNAGEKSPYANSPYRDRGEGLTK